MVTLQFFLSTWFYLAWLLRFTKMAACLQTRSFVCLLLPAFFCFLFIPCKSQSFHYKSRSCHHNFNRQSTDNLPTDYQQTADSRPTVGRQIVTTVEKLVGRQTADSWPSVGRLSANCRPSVGRQLAVCRPTVGQQSVEVSCSSLLPKF